MPEKESGKAGKPEAEQESSSHGGKVKQIANKRRPNDNNVECPQRTLQKILKREKIKKVTHISKPFINSATYSQCDVIELIKYYISLI